MGFVSAVLGGRIRIVLVALLVVVGGLGGAYAMGILGAPSVDGIDNRFAGVNETATVIETDVRVSNPNPISATLSGISVDYSVSMNDIRMANGSKAGVSIGKGTTAIPLRTTLANERIPDWWVSHIQNGEHTDLAVNATVTSSTLGQSFEAPEITRPIDTDLLSAFNSTETREVNADAPVVSDPVLYINETRAEWGETTEEQTALDLTFVVHNPKSYPVAITELGYGISMNDVTVGNGTTESEYVIPAKSTETIEATTYIDNENLDEWWVTHIERNQTTDLRIEFDAKIDAAGSTFTVPLDALTYEKTFETDIFGNKGDSETGDSTAANGETATETSQTGQTTTASETDTQTTTAEGQTTSSPTDSPTPTPTPTTTATTTQSESGTTTTDDGLL
ncbi:LEA type 2 family protein [Haloferax sp. S1W]|uniref:LEA type 2 family protein n=1 Tax=Haloferax sp. S1W TaxID=3377110 RepID=UPI0037C9D1FD